MGNFDVKDLFKQWTVLADALNMENRGEDEFSVLLHSFERSQTLQELEGKELNHIWKTDAYQKECEELDKWW